MLLKEVQGLVSVFYALLGSTVVLLELLLRERLLSTCWCVHFGAYSARILSDWEPLDGVDWDAAAGRLLADPDV